MVNRILFWTVLLMAVAMSSACGGSGVGSEKQNVESAGQSADFAVTFDRSSITVAAGTVTPPVTLQITPLGNFHGVISVSGQLPAGFSCVQSSCSATSSAPNYNILIRFSTSASLPAGAYTANFVASSGSISHQSTVSIRLTPPVPSQPNRSVFVPNGALFPGEPVFDSGHAVVYAPDPQANVVHVISTRNHQIINDVYVPSPAGLDISASGKFLYVGSATQYLYVVDTGKLAVVDRVRLPNSVLSTIFPFQVVTLSSGKVLVRVGCDCSTASALEIYDPSNRSFASVPLLYMPTFVSRSADHSSAYIVAGSTVARYDAATDALVSNQFTSGEHVQSLVASPDKTTLVAVLDCCGLALLDANLNVRAKSVMNEPLSELVFSPDSSRLYMDHGDLTQVFSASDLSSLGSIPSVVVYPNLLTLAGWDDDQHLIAYGPYSTVFIDASIPPGPFADQDVFYSVGIGSGNSMFRPDNPSQGLASSFWGGTLAEVPLVTFGGIPATDVMLVDGNRISLDAPSLSGVRDVDVIATYPDGYSLLAPSAYSYAPRISYLDGQISAENDAGKITIYGYGFNFQPSQMSLTIGGAPATNLQVSGAIDGWSPTPLYAISANVAPGVQGPADIILNTPIGSSSLPAAFHYAHRDDYALASGASPFQMVYDQTGNRLFWTDLAASTVEVFSIASRSIVAHIPIGIEPAGLSLTPDGTKLLVAVFGQKQLAIVDTATLKVTSQVATPFDPLDAQLDPRPIYIVTTNNGKAFLLNTINGYGCLSIYEFDLATSSFKERKDTGVCSATERSTAGVSADGSRAILGAAIYTAADDAFTPLPNGNDYSSRALNADGSAIVAFRAFHAPDGARNGVAIAPAPIESDVDSNSIYGEQLNSTGSLLYFPEKDRIRIFDVRHGTLARTLMVPDGLRATGDCLSIDAQGRGLWVMTSRGLSHFTFDSDPLSIGEVNNNAGQLIVSGSGFDPRSQILIDGILASSAFVDANHLTASFSGIPAGTHQLTVQISSGASYTLDAAFVSQ